VSPGLFLALALLLGATITAHLWYLRTYGAQLTRMTRAVMWLNIALIVGVTMFLGFAALSSEVN
jgi:hypothetical protein